jgi:hydrogenase/urease accessory protein HupE
MNGNRRAILGRLFRPVIGLMLAALVHVPEARSHESRPAYLEINQVSRDRFEVLWHTPLLAGMRFPVVLRFPDAVHNVTEPVQRELPGSLLERRLVEAVGGLEGKSIEFMGLQATITDVLVRVQMSDGTRSTTLVHSSRPWIDIATAQGVVAIATAYLMHGIEHILFGFDHLLFVLALILIVSNGRVLLLTITAFTVAHSITLSLATLGIVRVPGPPVEATIALSILLLACEIMRRQRSEASLSAKWPWVVAFSFGLLHGFGFASALTEIGLPRGDIPLALFAFNVGVEIGQLIFIGVVLGTLACAKWIGLPTAIERHALRVATYAIGILAAFWFVERLAGFAA